MALMRKNVMLLFFILSLLLAISQTFSARVLNSTYDDVFEGVGDGISTNGGSSTTTSSLECWDALSEVTSCSDKIYAYFTGGKADIGPYCCRAINVITHNCWPAILTALGFSTDQTFVLRGYCDASSPNDVVAAGPAEGPSSA
ncbi:OLC1v1008863C1 [Oldenlandia corymbosa var. corymbosa]|uniref:OLC1v1008863C1 n=1 Tax=Oldenlandia corymbosa var. corymbosa TaxID=529605 RepID=A0AAV1DQW0_OLDCO|nr:OLC1v1008863C1 [Oldenlandia corymbosa var. corymbosa]